MSQKKQKNVASWGKRKETGAKKRKEARVSHNHRVGEKVKKIEEDTFPRRLKVSPLKISAHKKLPSKQP